MLFLKSQWNGDDFVEYILTSILQSLVAFGQVVSEDMILLKMANQKQELPWWSCF